MSEFKPMRMTDVPFERAMEYITNEDWVLEQKLDGARTLLQYTREPIHGQQFVWLASNGEPMKFSAAVQHFETLESQLKPLFESLNIDYAHLDGELIVEDGTFHVFDLPTLNILGEEGVEWLVMPRDPYVTRKTIIEDFFGEFVEQENVFIAYTAWSEEEKRELWQRINEANVEGGMAKRRTARYVFGTRSKDMHKLKLVKTADVVVTSVQRTFKADGKTLSHGKAELAVTIKPEDDPQPFVDAKGKRWSDAELNAAKRKPAAIDLKPRTMLPVGNASLIGKPLSIEVGSVVEVAYLYLQDAMIQPRIVRERLAEEKTAEQCDMAQFPTYSRERV